MNGDLISREAMKKDFEYRLKKAKNWKENALNNGDEELVIRADATIDFICEVIMTIDNAPTVELDESVIQEVLNKRCMTAVANEYLIALHGKRPQGEWNYIQAGMAVCPFCGATPHKQYKNFCPNCGAKMQKGGAV